MNKKAFTLIELLVVVLIIGTLAAIALPQYRVAVLKARITEAIINMKALEVAQNEFFLDNDKWAQTAAELEELTIPVSQTICGSDFCQNYLLHDKYGIIIEFVWAAHQRKCIARSTNTVSTKACASFGGEFLGTYSGYDYYMLP